MNEAAADLKEWMDARGLSAAQVAKDLGTEEQTVRKWRSQGVPPRRIPHVTRYMSEWIDPATVQPHPVISDEAVTAFVESKQNLVLHPTEEQFNAWTAAFKASPAATLKEWAVDGLSDLASLQSKPGNAPLQSLPAPKIQKQNGA